MSVISGIANVISGIAKKFDGTAIDYVSIFNWDDGKCIAQVVPDNSGNWQYKYKDDLQVGLTYVADGCKPITHGSYYFEFLGDKYADNVVALLHFDDSLTDQTGRLWTVNSSPAFVAGKSNNALQLSGNALYTPYNSNFDWDTDDFTIECFVKASTWASFSVPGMINGVPMLIGRMGQSNDINQWSFGPVASGKLHFYYFSSGQKLLIASSGTLPVNEWVHIAFCKDATNAYVAIDGVVTSAALPASITLPAVSEKITIGRYHNNSVDGFIDELRITKGVARYVDSFEPPQIIKDASTDSLGDPYAGNVVALLHFDGDLTDVSGNCSFENLGNISYEDGVFNKALEFTPASSTSRNGLLENIVNNPALSLGAGDFTIEFFISTSASYKQNDQVLLSLFDVSDFAGWQVYLSGMKLVMYKYDYKYYGGGNTVLSSTTTLIANKWYHVAYCRLNGISSLYIDGIADISAPDDSNYSTTGIKLSIGYQEHGNARYPFTGMLDEIRITKGVARYTENFTQPTEPFTL